MDRLHNTTGDQTACATPLVAPPPPSALPQQLSVEANPSAVGLVGLDSWFWLTPSPGGSTLRETYHGTQYVITATPSGADWDFGDGTAAKFQGTPAFGSAYPQRSSVSHVYQAHSATGYAVQAWVRYELTWTALEGGRAFGPYPLGEFRLAAAPLVYPVQQAQPELLLV